MSLNYLGFAKLGNRTTTFQASSFESTNDDTGFATDRRMPGFAQFGNLKRNKAKKYFEKQTFDQADLHSLLRRILPSGTGNTCQFDHIIINLVSCSIFFLYITFCQPGFVFNKCLVSDQRRGVLWKRRTSNCDRRGLWHGDFPPLRAKGDKMVCDCIFFIQII